MTLSLVILAAVSSCGGDVTPQAEFKPTLLPVKIVVDPSGISLEGSSPNIATPIGTFSIGAKYALPEREEQTIYVIIRDRKKGDVGFDTVYKVRTGRTISRRSSMAPPRSRCTTARSSST